MQPEDPRDSFFKESKTRVLFERLCIVWTTPPQTAQLRTKDETYMIPLTYACRLLIKNVCKILKQEVYLSLLKSNTNFINYYYIVQLTMYINSTEYISLYFSGKDGLKGCINSSSEISWSCLLEENTQCGFTTLFMWSLSGLCDLLFHLRGEDNAKNKK